MCVCLLRARAQLDDGAKDEEQQRGRHRGRRDAKADAVALRKRST